MSFKTHARANPHIVWKILDASSIPGRLFSSGMVGKHEVEYVPGQITEHPNIFIFTKLEAAKTYKGSSHQPIWECITLKVKPAPDRMLLASQVNKYYDDFWGAWERGEHLEKFQKMYDPNYQSLEWYSYTTETPEGIALCDSLVLIRRIA